MDEGRQTRPNFYNGSQWENIQPLLCDLIFSYIHIDFSTITHGFIKYNI